MTDDERPIIDLGSGWYRMPDGWTEEEVLDDIRSMFPTGLGLHGERVIRERVSEAFAARAEQRRGSEPETVGPIATPEQAHRAFAEYQSDRKAAAALGISRTQLRRLRGKDV